MLEYSYHKYFLSVRINERRMKMQFFVRQEETNRN